MRMRSKKEKQEKQETRKTKGQAVSQSRIVERKNEKGDEGELTAFPGKAEWWP